jgi:hypothetical protein
MDDATGDTNGVGSAYLSGASDFNIDFMVEFRFAFVQLFPHFLIQKYRKLCPDWDPDFLSI